MSCPWADRLELYVDGELPETERAEIAAHLLSCGSCAADALARLQLKRAIQAAAANRFSPQPAFRARIEKTIGATRSTSSIRRRWLAIAAAAAMSIALTLSLLWLRIGGREQTLSELVDLHVSTLASANPVDVVSSDRHTVKPWFQGKLPFTFNVPDLVGTPFQLLGGRVAYFRQNPGAQLLFEFRRHRISVFIFQDRGELRGPSAPQRRLAFHIDAWKDDGLRYYMISDAAPGEIDPLRSLLTPAK